MTKTFLPLATFICIFACMITSCSHNRYEEFLTHAEEHVTRNIDSTFLYLDSISVEDLKGEQRARWQLLHTWAQFRRFDKVIPLEPLNEAFSYYADSKNKIRKAQVYYLRSVVREDQKDGEPTEWLQDLYTACNAIAQTNDHVLAGQIYMRYGGAFYKRHQYEQSAHWDSLFLQEGRLSGRVDEQINALQNLALAQFFGHMGGEIPTIMEALKLAEDNNRQVDLGKVCGKLSFFYARAQQYDSVLYYALRAKNIDEEQFRLGKRTIPVNYIHVANAYLELGQADSTIYYAMKDTLNPSFNTRRIAYQLLYTAYNELKNDPGTAIIWMKGFNALGDSLRVNSERAQMQEVAKIVETSSALDKMTNRHRMDIFWIVVIVILSIIAIIFLIRYMRFNQKEFRHKLKEQEEEFNRLFSAQNNIIFESEKKTADSLTSIEMESADKPIEVIKLTGSTKDQIELNPNAILYLTAESNYIKVVYMNDTGKVEQKTIRQTMNQAEVMLENCKQVVRCHRAFFVGLRHVDHAKSIPTGLLLTLRGTSTEIPVSRTYIGKIKEDISKMQR